MIEQARARDLNDRNLSEYFVGSKGQSEKGFSSTVVEKEKWRRMMVVKKIRERERERERERLREDRGRRSRRKNRETRGRDIRRVRRLPWKGLALSACESSGRRESERQREYSRRIRLKGTRLAYIQPKSRIHPYLDDGIVHLAVLVEIRSRKRIYSRENDT
ncbi:hypothetical protein ALC57_13030 [Trachymyrmex cornetzi]|uniref:Uncharacterized protein n=1 Tax=Trachymyrmex cornetzi TaxID=471704 RepID=A0A151J044_9HYME|nr:hypothetical protein ALC57_13030 [Trachymyrmex cornetzi]